MLSKVAILESKQKNLIQQAKPGAIIRLFNFFGSRDEEVATANNVIAAGTPKGVPVLSKWRKKSDDSISGIISVPHLLHCRGCSVNISSQRRGYFWICGYNSVGIQVRDAYIICFVSLAIFPSKEPYYVFFILPGVFCCR